MEFYFLGTYLHDNINLIKTSAGLTECNRLARECLLVLA